MTFCGATKMYPSNHKTIFVLDHTPYFGISSDNPIELDFLKSRGPGCLPIPPFSKSLWTTAFEAAIEYCRIVWDLFPQGKLVRFIASDHQAHVVNNWNPSQQHIGHIMGAMSVVGVPPPIQNTKIEYTVLHGLKEAMLCASELTELQQEKLNLDQQGKLINKCRVICITSTRDHESMVRLEEIFLSGLMQHNKNLVKSDGKLPIDHCHLVLINTFPVKVVSQVQSHPPKNLSPLLTTEVHSVNASIVPSKLSALILDHYDLASTTVTGIPMKEEQNASSSANYDVEIYHESTAHLAILKGNAADSAIIKTFKENNEYETVTLKWCTPRFTPGNEMQNCISMHRITPVDVNSRPSLCLINFLLNGRSVMLEMPRKAGGKITSHLLSAHGGEIFIHTLCTARSVLEDPPSISEGPGGRVTDYRITDFGLLIKQNTLVPIKPGSFDKDTIPILEMKNRLERHTKYWPLTISSTLIFNLKMYIDPLPLIITKETITDEEVFQCKQILRNFLALEGRHEPLHLLNPGQRIKGQKRDEQYRAVWDELDMLIRENLHSEQHRAIHKVLLECHGVKDDKTKTDENVRESENAPKSDEQRRASVIRATTDSPMSPPPLTTIASSPLIRSNSKFNSIYSAPKTLFDIILAQEKPKPRLDFCGRSSDNLVAKLYPNFKGDNDRAPRSEAMETE